jgi:transcriptional regulator with XRE-family HTH domain
MTSRTGNRTQVGRQSIVIRRAIGAEIRRLRLDAGTSQRLLAEAAGIDQGFLSRIEAATAEPSIAVLVAIGQVLGADLTVRFYPTTGPRIHDRIQAAMAETLLEVVSPRWKRLVEVPVRRPARGSIDVVLADPEAPLVVAAELQSDLRRIEQQIRWAADKADSLPSAEAWPMLTASMTSPVAVGRLLVLRSTERTRAVARQFATILRIAYPANTAQAVDALTGTSPWPGNALIGCRVESGHARLQAGPPRGVELGR